MLLSSNGISAGLRLAFQDIEGADEALYSSKTKLRDPINFKIRNVLAYGNHDHPGGIQAQGDIVAIAMEDPKGGGKHAAVYFVEVRGKNFQFLNTLMLDGSRGEPNQKTRSKAATVGFIQLKTFNYLVAVAGANHGKKVFGFTKVNKPKLQTRLPGDS